MTTHGFRSVVTHRTRTGKCPNCGKTVRRSRKFEQTVNPFNRTKSGKVRTVEQVLARVNAEADAWVPDFKHCDRLTPPTAGSTQ